MGFLTEALSKAAPVQTAYRKGWVGDPMYVQDDDDWIGNGRNATRSTGQTSRIVFDTPGTLAPGAKVFLLFKQADCSEVVLPLSNSTAAATPLAALVAEKINGVGTTGSFAINTSGLVGYKATATAATFTVDIVGPPGAKFEIEDSDFGSATTAPPPTITITAVSTHPEKLGYGLAVVRNIALASMAYGQGRSIATEYDRIVSTPTNSLTEEFLGFSVRRQVGELHINHDACEPSNCDEGYGCGECAHWMRTTLHENKIIVRLEPFAAGTPVPATLVGLPVFYRHTSAPGYLIRGAASVLAGTDPNRTLAKGGGGKHEWYVAEVANAARREYFIGVR